MAIRRIAAVCGAGRGKTSGAAQACISCILGLFRLDRAAGGTDLRRVLDERFTMRVAHQIREKLTAALNPERLEIADESHRHAGHAGSRPGGETHFRVEVVAAAFQGKSRLERQRLVYAALKDEMSHQIHALSLVTRAPGEAG